MQSIAILAELGFKLALVDEFILANLLTLCSGPIQVRD